MTYDHFLVSMNSSQVVYGTYFSWSNDRDSLWNDPQAIIPIRIVFLIYNEIEIFQTLLRSEPEF